MARKQKRFRERISRIKPFIKLNMKLIMWWFDFLMILVTYLAVASQLAARGLTSLNIILFAWLMIYFIGKIWFFASDIKPTMK